ncbi:hypothetical protein D3C75_628380 [compost metagenome]
MRGNRNHRDFVAFTANPLPDNVARMRRCAEPFMRHTRPVEQRFIPVVAVDIHQLRGGCVGVFPVQCASQAEAEIVRDQQGVLDVIDQFRLLFHQRTELIERVKWQELNAGTAVNIFTAQLLERDVHHAIGTAVAVGNRLPDALAFAVNQHVIHTPSVDADAVDSNAFVAGFLQAGTDFIFQRVDIPDGGSFGQF